EWKICPMSIGLSSRPKRNQTRPRTATAATTPTMMRRRATVDRSVVFWARLGVGAAVSRRGVFSLAKAPTRLPADISIPSTALVTNVERHTDGTLRARIGLCRSTGEPGRLVGGRTNVPPHTGNEPTSSAPEQPAAQSVGGALQRFLASSASSGYVLLAALVVALCWANSPWASAYDDLWSTPLVLHVGSTAIGTDLRFWIGDGLMTVFFLLVGMEIKREVREGELRDPRAAALPAVAALGGMVVPALLYLAIVGGG